MWLDNLADDVTPEGAAIEATVLGTDELRNSLLDARELYAQLQSSSRATTATKALSRSTPCLIQRAPTSAVVTVSRNAGRKAQHVVVKPWSRSSAMLFARLVGEKYAGTPFAR